MQARHKKQKVFQTQLCAIIPPLISYSLSFPTFTTPTSRCFYSLMASSSKQLSRCSNTQPLLIWLMTPQSQTTFIALPRSRGIGRRYVFLQTTLWLIGVNSFPTLLFRIPPPNRASYFVVAFVSPILFSVGYVLNAMMPMCLKWRGQRQSRFQPTSK